MTVMSVMTLYQCPIYTQIPPHPLGGEVPALRGQEGGPRRPQEGPGRGTHHSDHEVGSFTGCPI